jgi:hypothetical protein
VEWSGLLQGKALEHEFRDCTVEHAEGNPSPIPTTLSTRRVSSQSVVDLLRYPRVSAPILEKVAE